MREALDEPTIVRTKSEKRADLLEGIDVTRIDRAHSFDFLGVHFETMARNDVPEVLALDSEQDARGGLARETSPSEPLQDETEMMEHLFEGGVDTFLERAAWACRPNSDVVQVRHADFRFPTRGHGAPRP